MERLIEYLENEQTQNRHEINVCEIVEKWLKRNQKNCHHLPKTLESFEKTIRKHCSLNYINVLEVRNLLVLAKEQSSEPQLGETNHHLQEFREKMEKGSLENAVRGLVFQLQEKKRANPETISALLIQRGSISLKKETRKAAIVYNFEKIEIGTSQRRDFSFQFEQIDQILRAAQNSQAIADVKKVAPKLPRSEVRRTQERNVPSRIPNQRRPLDSSRIKRDSSSRGRDSRTTSAPRRDRRRSPKRDFRRQPPSYVQPPSQLAPPSFLPLPMMQPMMQPMMNPVRLDHFSVGYPPLYHPLRPTGLVDPQNLGSGDPFSPASLEKLGRTEEVDPFSQMEPPLADDVKWGDLCFP